MKTLALTAKKQNIWLNWDILELAETAELHVLNWWTARQLLTWKLSIADGSTYCIFTPRGGSFFNSQKSKATTVLRCSKVSDGKSANTDISDPDPAGLGNVNLTEELIYIGYCLFICYVHWAVWLWRTTKGKIKDPGYFMFQLHYYLLFSLTMQLNNRCADGRRPALSKWWDHVR